MSNGQIDPLSRDARGAAEAIRQRKITSEALTESCLERIRQSENRVNAWAHIDPELARRQARAADEALQRTGRPRGALHGVPVGLKDIFDTADMPTENGTVLDSGRRVEGCPRRFPAAQCRRVILGKT